MTRLVSLSVLAAFLAIGTIGCNSEPPKKTGTEGSSPSRPLPPSEKK